MAHVFLLIKLLIMMYKQSKTTSIIFFISMRFVIYFFVAVSMMLLSCASATSVSFLCENEDLQIYVNDQYVGTGLVRYTAPEGVTTAVVECKKDGITIYSKDYYIKGHKNALFDIKVPSYNSYSSDRQIHSK